MLSYLFVFLPPSTQILGVLASHPSTDDVLEPALGLLTNIMLRLPEVAAKAAAAGAIDVVIEVMQARPAAAQVRRWGEEDKLGRGVR